MILSERGYNGNTNLKRKDTQIQWSPDMVQEFVKCAKDEIYFAEKYIQ